MVLLHDVSKESKVYLGFGVMYRMTTTFNTGGVISSSRCDYSVRVVKRSEALWPVISCQGSYELGLE